MKRPCWGKIPTNNMDLKQRHRLDAITNNIKLPVKYRQGHGLLIQMQNDCI